MILSCAVDSPRPRISREKGRDRGGRGAPGAAWKCAAKWRDRPAPPTAPAGRRAAWLGGRGWPPQRGRSIPAAQTPEPFWGGSRTRAFPARGQLPGSPTVLISRRRPHWHQMVGSDVRRQPPPIRGASPSQGGGSRGLGQARLCPRPSFLPVGPTGHSRGPGVYTAYAPAVRAPALAGPLGLPGGAAPHPTPVITSRLGGQGAGLPQGRSSQAEGPPRRRHGAPGPLRSPRLPGTATTVHVSTAPRTPCERAWGRVPPRSPREGNREHESGFP